MFRSRANTFAVGSALVGVFSVNLPVQAQVSVGVRSQLADAAAVAVASEGTVRDFAQILAASRIPAGIVVLSADTPRSAHASIRKPAGVYEPLGKSLDQFSRSHPEYLVRDAEGALLMAHRQSQCLTSLNRTVRDLKLDGPPFRIAHELMRKLRPELPNVPPGVVSGGGTPGPRPLLVSGQVSLYFSETTLLQAFQQISQQVPGLVWGVVQGQDSRTGSMTCMLHWFEAETTAASSFNILSTSAK